MGISGVCGQQESTCPFQEANANEHETINIVHTKTVNMARFDDVTKKLQIQISVKIFIQMLLINKNN